MILYDAETLSSPWRIARVLSLCLAALAACHDNVILGKLSDTDTRGSTSSSEESGPMMSSTGTSGAVTTGPVTSGTGTSGPETSGCETACEAGPKFVFVSSQLYTGNLGGLEGAAAKCQALAEAAELPGTYRAWLSDNTGSPLTWMTKSTEPYVLPDGTKVADGWHDLIDSMLDTGINMTEHKGKPPLGPFTCGPGAPSVWSNTDINGELLDSNGSCSNWSSTRGETEWGRADAFDVWWTTSCGPIPCEWVGLIYCFEQ
jgi:hypothetical protein